MLFKCPLFLVFETLCSTILSGVAHILFNILEVVISSVLFYHVKWSMETSLEHVTFTVSPVEQFDIFFSPL